MRVLHVIPSLAAVHGGPSVVLPIMERALSAEGVEVETVTTDDDGPGRRHDKGDGMPREENGVIRRYFPKQTEFYKVSLPLARWLKREVGRFDVVHIHAMFSHTSIAAARAARRAGVPYVIRPLGVLNQYGVKQRRAFLKRLSLRWVEGPLLRDAAAIHFTLADERDEAQLLGLPFTPVVIPLGLEATPLPAANSDARPTVLYLSRIDPKKNIEELLGAWKIIQPAHPDWQLVIAGSGDPGYEESLRKLAAELGVASSVVWPGLVKGQEKSQLLSDAQIFTLPSHSENFGIAAAEALLAGKPCVFTPGVAVGALAASHGAALLAADPTAESIAPPLASLMDHPETRAALAARAKHFAAAELSAAVMGRNLKTLYQRLSTLP
jgi:glycosyltransferase involved in cell wall biosynthesis